MRPTQMKNWLTIGWSSPRFSLIWAMSASVAESPPMTAAGSPGVSLSIRNTMSATIIRTGITAAIRRATYIHIVSYPACRFMGEPG